MVDCCAQRNIVKRPRLLYIYQNFTLRGSGDLHVLRSFCVLAAELARLLPFFLRINALRYNMQQV